MEGKEITENELFETFVKLRKHDLTIHSKIEVMLVQNGDFSKALEQNWSSKYDDPERVFKAKMSVNPDRIIKLAEKLKRLQKEYDVAHQKLREFEAKHPSIVEKYGSKLGY